VLAEVSVLVADHSELDGHALRVQTNVARRV
jgi:hypothetical protein